MTNILFNIVRIWDSQFKWNYLKKEKLFPNFVLIFPEYTSNFKHFDKKDDFHS